MARSRKAKGKPAAGKRRIEQYDHKGQQRKNNPPVGPVTNMGRFVRHLWEAIRHENTQAPTPVFNSERNERREDGESASA